jgi:hypothetical protein
MNNQKLKVIFACYNDTVHDALAEAFRQRCDEMLCDN